MMTKEMEEGLGVQKIIIIMLYCSEPHVRYDHRIPCVRYQKLSLTKDFHCRILLLRNEKYQNVHNL